MIEEGKICKVCNTTLKYVRSNGKSRSCVCCSKEKHKLKYIESGGYSGYNKEYYHKNKEKAATSRRKYYMNDKNVYIYYMLKRAENRAKKDNLDFNITKEDIYIPNVCPILGVPFIISEGKGPRPFSPSLDKIDPKKGYVKGNIIVISLRANQIKSNASIEEIEKVLFFLKNITPTK